MIKHIGEAIHGHDRHSQPASGQDQEPMKTRGKIIRWAGRYDLMVQVLLLGKAGSFRRATAALAGIKPGDRVLDVGCGTGELTLAAARLAGPEGESQGIDAADEMVAVARAKPVPPAATVNFQRGLIERIPFVDGYFDVVLSSMMMHHLPGDLKQAGLGEILRVLKPGGRVLIVDFQRPTGGGHSHHPASLFLHRNLEAGIQDLLPLVAAAGFEEIDTGNTGFGPAGYLRARKPSSA